MAENSKIEWTTHTFNPWRGCTKVSAGCKNCYAETLSHRNPKTLGVWGPNGTRVIAAESAWRQPLKWNKAAKAAGERHRVFCASLADVFEDWTGNMVAANGKPLFAGTGRPDWWTDREDDVPAVTMGDVRARLFRLIHETANLDWLLLTKRPENVAAALGDYSERIDHYAAEAFEKVWMRRVWLGTSVENQATADERIPHLLKTPAAVRFLSCEPLLGPVDLTRIPCPGYAGVKFDSLLKRGKGSWGTGAAVDWVIVGGESGSGARPMDIIWARSIVEQCKASGVAVFVKQLGAKPLWQERDSQGDLWQEELPRTLWRVPLLDRKGGDITEFPADLQAREFPEVRA